MTTTPATTDATDITTTDILPLDNLVLVYQDEEGNLYEQPAGNLTEVGGLIDPETGEDLELIGYKVA